MWISAGGGSGIRYGGDGGDGIAGFRVRHRQRRPSGRSLHQRKRRGLDIAECRRLRRRILRDSPQVSVLVEVARHVRPGKRGIRKGIRERLIVESEKLLLKRRDRAKLRTLGNRPRNLRHRATDFIFLPEASIRVKPQGKEISAGRGKFGQRYGVKIGFSGRYVCCGNRAIQRRPRADLTRQKPHVLIRGREPTWQIGSKHVLDKGTRTAPMPDCMNPKR